MHSPQTGYLDTEITTIGYLNTEILRAGYGTALVTGTMKLIDRRLDTEIMAAGHQHTGTENDS